MAREPNIPLFLWVAVAIVAHLFWGGGAHQAAGVFEQRRELHDFVVSVHRHVQHSTQTFEVALLEDDAEAEPEQLPPSQSDQGDVDPTDEPEDDPDENQPELPTASDEPAAAADEAEKRAVPEQQPEQNEPPPEREKKKEEEQKPPEQQPELPKQVLQLNNRIAVQQHVKDENQDPNPNAEFIAEQANKVEEQTQARITSTDQNDPMPSAGSLHEGPSNDPGDSHVSELGQSEDTPGEMDRAPHGEAGGDQAISQQSAVARLGSRGDRLGFESNQEAPEQRRALGDATTASRARDAKATSPAVEAAPDLIAGRDGSWAVPGPREAQRARKGQKAKQKRLPRKRPRPVEDLLGLGRSGTTSNGINLNLSHQGAVAAIGQDQLVKEAQADGERRRSKHRGSWRVGIERWRSAIENYVPMVKAGNQTRLNTAQVPFASYLNKIHNRLHPIFAGNYLASLNDLDGTHPMNRMDMHTNLEIVLSRQDGSLVRMGVTKTSGVTAFDILALEAVNKAAPFGTPPTVIVSPDGNVYFHWEFHRDPRYACSTYFARPYLLKAQPKTAPPKMDPPSEPFDPREQPEPPGNQRHGFFHEPHPRHAPAPGIIFSRPIFSPPVAAPRWQALASSDHQRWHNRQRALRAMRG